MGFFLLPRRAMARRGLIAALLGQSQAQGCSSFPVQLLIRSYSNKLFVGGLSFRTDEDAVRRAFSQHGEVVEVKLISDRETGRPKGFGFVTFESEADAEAARSKMTGQVLDGRVIRVDKATSSRPPLPSSGFSSGLNSGSGGGSFSSPVPSPLPPVAEDWGTIPSNIVDLGARASPTVTPISRVDLSKPFDNSSFGQAAVSWPASMPATASNANSETLISSSADRFVCNKFDSATTFSGNDFGSANAFSSSDPGPAISLSTSSPSTSFPGVARVPSSQESGISTSDSFSSSTLTTTSSSNALVSVQQSSTSTITSSSSFGVATLDTNPFSSGTFGSASGNASMYGPVSTENTSATIFKSNTAPISSITDTGPSSASSGAADANDPLKSTAVPGSASIASAMSAPNVPPAHPLSSPALTSSGSFDFSNFSFNSGSYRDNDPPLPRRRPRPRPRLATQTMSSDFNSSTSLLETRSPFGSNNQFAETSIPKPKGTEMDFGLLNITAPSSAGMRPQGVFDIYIPDDLPEIPPPEPKPKPKPMSLSMFPHRQLPALDLPYHTPEADNSSEIGKDPPKYDLSTLFPSMGELIKKEKEFHWDPFDFDPEFKLPPEEKVIIIDSDYDEPL